MIDTDEEQTTGPMFNCGTCGTSTPWPGKHTCQLNDRQRRSLEAARHKEAARIRAENADRPCPDCGQSMRKPGGHACRIRRDPVAEETARLQFAGMVAQLAAAGLKVVPE